MISGVGAAVRGMIDGAIEGEFPDGRPYRWVITRDRGYELDVASADGLGGGFRNRQGTSGPVHYSEAADEGLTAGLAIPFRIYGEGDVDERGEWFGEYPDARWRPAPGVVDRDHPDYGLLYEGLIYIVPGHEQDWRTAPIDDFVRANDGYGDIRYLNEDGTAWISVS